MKPITVLLLILLLTPSVAQASDFNVLTTGIVSSAITILIVFLGIKGSTASKNVGLSKATPFLVLLCVLMFIATALILEEKDHMGNTDFLGMMAFVLVPGIFFTILSLIIQKK